MKAVSLTKQLVVHVGLLAGVMVCFRMTNIDRAVQDSFYLWDVHYWLIDRHEPVLRFFFAIGPLILLVTMGVICLVVWIRSYHERRYAERARRCLLLLLSLVIVPPAVAGFNRLTEGGAPYQAVRYGGVEVNERAVGGWAEDLTREKTGRDWPGGQASAGFALMMLYFVLRRKSDRIAGLVAGLVAGWMIGLYQTLDGERYLSHTIISMQMAWILVLVIHEAVAAWPMRDRSRAGARDGAGAEGKSGERGRKAVRAAPAAGAADGAVKAKWGRVVCLLLLLVPAAVMWGGCQSAGISGSGGEVGSGGVGDIGVRGARGEKGPGEMAGPVVRGVPRFARVSETLYRGGQPTAEGLAELKKLGIKTVVSLRMRGKEPASLKALGLRYYHISCKNVHPEEEDVLAFLRIVSERENQPVFVHCRDGTDRTGMMVAVYRMVIEGWPKEKAWAEMQAAGFHKVWRPLAEYVQELDVAALKEKLAGTQGR